MKRVTLRMPEELVALLDHAARRQQVSRSEVVRRALAGYLKAGRRGARVSCFDLAGDLVGSVEGALDLSTHPRHLEGFGT